MLCPPIGHLCPRLLGYAFSVTLLQLLATAQAEAQAGAPQTAVEIPAPLQPWVPWVLHGQESRLCVDSQEGPLCHWSSLELSLEESGGQFTVTMYAEHPQWFPLPGSSEHFPQAVELDGRPAVVLAGPKTRVSAGAHRLSGRFSWNELPETLSVPARTGQLSLRVEGVPIARPRRDARGRLWLDSATDDSVREERLELDVQRHLADDLPLRITTRIALSVGGKAREVVLPPPQLKGTTLVAINSTLPTRLDANGRLHVQVFAGEHDIELTALAATPPDSLQPIDAPPPWPTEEIWVWAANPNLRRVELSGAPQVDPKRTELPARWHDLPTYVLDPNTTLQLETKRRGDAVPPPNQLHLRRQLWLDLDGSAITARDDIHGQLYRDSRLNLVQGNLGRVSLSGEDQLITRYEELEGIELRTPNLAMTAEWRMPHNNSPLPAVAWSVDMDSVDIGLHVPPGWALLDTRGVDEAQGTLLARWDLWSFFFVLLVALAAGKLRGALWGAVALVTLVLCTHEPGAPEWVWLWLLAALGLEELPLQGAAQRVTRAFLLAAVLATAAVVVPFVTQQIQQALYPQLAATHSPDNWGSAASRSFVAKPKLEMLDEAEELAEPAASLAPPGDSEAYMNEDEASGGAQPVRRRQASSSVKRKNLWSRQTLQQPPQAIVQTGPGIPAWRHHHYALQWSGPVHKGQTFQLLLVPPWINRCLGGLRVLLLAALLFGLLIPLRRLRPPAAASLLALPLLLNWGVPVQAQTPDPTLLEELRVRLTKPADCHPTCINTSSLQLELRRNELTALASVHAAALAAYRVPGPLSTWSPTTISVDGQAATRSTRLNDDSLLLRLEPGTHRVQLRGPLPETDALLLELGTAPMQVSVSAPDWEVDGLRPDGTAESTIRLRRKIARGQTADTQVSEQQLPAWLSIVRRFDFGVQFRVETTVERIGNAQTAILTHYPLLKGETVTDADIETTDQRALLRLPAGTQSLRFSSTLPQAERYRLETPANHPPGQSAFSETWELRCGSIYHCASEGLAPTSRSMDGLTLHTYHPYPGETLHWDVHPLAAAAGNSTTIDRAELTWTPGERMTRAELTLVARTSGGANLALTLPPEAELGVVFVDGATRPAQAEQGLLQLTLKPGAQDVRIPFQLPAGIRNHYQTPVLKIAGDLVNVTVKMQVPHNRWLLWVQGPAWGPAVLFWGYLFAMLLLALVLARIPHSPLSTYQWALLTLGLSQVGIGGVLLVVVWFFAVRLRGEHPPPGRLRFNVVQLLLLGLTGATAGVLVEAVRRGLVVQPDMQVSGSGSSNHQLIWYVDRVQNALPTPTLISIPLWTYRALMLLWALWLAVSALKWLRWGYDQFAQGGRFRRMARPQRKAAGAESPPTSVDPADPTT